MDLLSYSMDNVTGFPKHYLLDSDLCSGYSATKYLNKWGLIHNFSFLFQCLFMIQIKNLS